MKLITKDASKNLKDFDTYSERTLCSGESYHIEPGVVHRFCATESGGDVTLCEVSTPELDDVIRIQDDSKRASGKILKEHKSYD